MRIVDDIEQWMVVFHRVCSELCKRFRIDQTVRFRYSIYTRIRLLNTLIIILYFQAYSFAKYFYLYTQKSII